MSDLVEKVAEAIFTTWAREKGSMGRWVDVCRATEIDPERFPVIAETHRLALLEARAAIGAIESAGFKITQHLD